MSSGAKSPEEVMAMAANDAVVTRSTSGATKNKPIMYKKKSASTASTLLTSSRNSSMTYLEPESDVFSSFIGSDITSKPSISGQSKVHFEIICSITTKDSEDKETVYKWVMRKTFSELSQFHEEVIGKFFPNILFPPKSLISIQMSERAIRNRR